MPTMRAVGGGCSMLYPSELVAKALSLSPDGSLPRWEGEASHCSHCAVGIAEGDAYSPLKAGAFFSDTRDLADASSIVCWRCVHLRSKVLLNGLSYALVTQDAIYPIAKDVHKAWLFLTPPEPPFLALHSSSTMQHLAWRTPVTLSKERIFIRFGGTLHVVRPALLRSAISIASALSARAGVDWLAPMFLDRKAEDDYHGRLNPKALPHLSDAEQEFYRSLGAGERWALAYLMHSKLPAPEQPEPITQTLADKIKG